jgi:hypothetical protein
MAAWLALLEGVVLAPGKLLDFKSHEYETHFAQPPLTAGDTFNFPFHGAMLSGSVIKATPDTALIANEGARYNIERIAQKWRIASKA